MRSSGNSQPSIISTNAFAALDTKTKKKVKKSGKDKDEKPLKDKTKAPSSTHPASSTGFTTFPAVTETNAIDLNWAEEEDDDDFGMVPMASWVQEHQQKAAAKDEPEEPQEPEDPHQDMVDIAEQLGLEVAHDEDSEEESEPPSEPPSKPASRNVSEITPRSAALRFPESKPEEKQLSKKEKRKKEMDELQAVLGELGIQANSQEEEEGAETKKKKKKKDKPKVSADEAPAATPEPAASSSVDASGITQEPAKVLDPSEAKKKLANKSAGKKKKSAVNPAFSRAAAEEAKIRAQRDAAQKDKDKKKHYNQQERR